MLDCVINHSCYTLLYVVQLKKASTAENQMDIAVLASSKMLSL